MNYEEMLERAYSKLPEKKTTEERFEIPKVRGHIQGNKTVISNFQDICSVLRRKPEHVLKFLLKELATPGELTKSSLILGRKISASQINEKIDKYAKIYVFCPECKKPDTDLVKEGSFTFIKCSVCGAKKSVP
ncbi:MAG: translation initiation factor IF-2 subunit beta [Candidatus Woesearchaeota archaeon]